jgi:broad specificity phosphatase PhoE
MQIILLRHGEPDLATWEKIPASQMPAWIAAYNDSGVKPDTGFVRDHLFAKFQSTFTVCSPLQRSIASAQLLFLDKPDLVDALFVEADLPVFKIPLIRLAPQVWGVLFRVFWFFGLSANGEGNALFKQRVGLAAESLVQLAHQHESVLLVGHGILNRFLAKELLAKGWVGEAAPNGKVYWSYRYWEYSVFTFSL